MATEAQLQANHRNASDTSPHGNSHPVLHEIPIPEPPAVPEPGDCFPRTASKWASSFNACKHGFHASDDVIAGEDPSDFETLAKAFCDQFEPQNLYELSLVRQLIDAEWCLRRVARLESSLLTARFDTVRRRADRDLDTYPDDPGEAEIYLLGRTLISDAQQSDPLSKLSRHEVRLHRQYARALALLEKLRKRSQDKAARREDGEHNQKSAETNPKYTPPPANDYNQSLRPDQQPTDQPINRSTQLRYTSPEIPPKITGFVDENQAIPP